MQQDHKIWCLFLKLTENDFKYTVREDVQHESGTSSVQAMMAVQIRHIISTNEDVQYKQVNNKVLACGGGGGALLKNTFQ